MKEQRPSSAPARRDVPWTLVAFGALAVYGILIALLNKEEVEISFVFFTTRISKLVLVLLCLGIGFSAGYLFERLRARRKARASAR